MVDTLEIRFALNLFCTETITIIEYSHSKKNTLLRINAGSKGYFDP